MRNAQQINNLKSLLISANLLNEISRGEGENYLTHRERNCVSVALQCVLWEIEREMQVTEIHQLGLDEIPF